MKIDPTDPQISGHPGAVTSTAQHDPREAVQRLHKTEVPRTMFQRLAQLFVFVGRNRFISRDELNMQLNFARSVGKRLDEHREVVEAISQKTDLFDVCWWHASHLATTDDYLMRLYYIVHNTWPIDTTENIRQPTGEYVRNRPAILGPCRLPEYPQPQPLTPT